ncbi:Alpha/Beta hydrolase protein [Dendryphion nanum]|uniref:Alpha/Beta hydrolase protein n=1 Tax=Dendryphion nanum TaxID=256645 RepID=A0A9P9DG33_9PLEO|nr:Alpha/Beta hydrolase protein [Dendryphion nanum]
MPFFSPSESLSIFYTTTGSPSNPPVLLIHGWGCDSHDWSWQIPFLSKTYYVIAHDSRGHGRSSASESIELSGEAFVADAVSLLRHLGIEKDVLVVGHSMGGVIASALAVMEEGLVKGLVLVEPAYIYPGAVYDALHESRKGLDVMDWASASYETLFTDAVLDWMRTWYLRRLQSTPKYVISGCMDGFYIREEGIGRFENHKLLVAKRTIPKLVVVANTQSVDKEKEIGLGKLDELIFMEGGGHWLHQAKSEEFNAAITKWLERING